MTATLTKTQGAIPAGVYLPTSVDAQREAAVVTIIGSYRKRTEIVSTKRFSGAGVKLVEEKDGKARYLVTDEALIEISRRYSTATDF